MYINFKKMCQECNEVFYPYELVWIKDRYGIPYKEVCLKCRDEVEEYISNWQHDYLDAGERLE